MTSTQLYSTQTEWDLFNYSMANIFEIEYNQTPFEPTIIELHNSNYNRKGLKHTEESKRLMSESKIGLIPWNKNKSLPPLTNAHKKALSKSLIGKAAWNKGIPNTPEQKAKISKSLSENNPMDNPDNRQKVSKALKGRVFSPEWKLKLSIAAKERCAKKKLLQENNK